MTDAEWRTIKGFGIGFFTLVLVISGLLITAYSYAAHTLHTT